MLNAINISHEDLIHEMKLSHQIPATIASIVHRKIIESTAETLGIKVEPEELQQAADNFRHTHKLWSANDTWAWLQAHYLSLDEFEASIYINALSLKLAQHLFAEQVEPFFVEHQLDFTQAVLYEVVLDDPDLAMELYYAIQEGEMNFHEMAHQYIQDQELRRTGGYRGTLQRRNLLPELSAAVFAATPPQVMKPIVTAKGAHLILVEEVVQTELNQWLYHQILSDLSLQWLKQQAEHIDVVTELHTDAIDQLPAPSYSSSAAG
ncbi:MAG: peptidylprolyl isomerase [Stenomitos rutilans HA7619-LM2]|jgi:hypothetical protein|nr:peptidylprolyl isomerase [Stenomitos rutilans HA7619-LM2]